MGESIAWWITLELLGLIALPVTTIVLRALPDRGYTVSKVVGLLLVGWLGYTLSMLQLAQFSRGLLIFCSFALAAFSAWLLFRNGAAMLREWKALLGARSLVRYLLAAEVIFTLAFIVWAILRAYIPDIFNFEKFMDFGFMNAIAKSPTFPPNDMWLSGYSINYYYFGYVLMTGLTLLAGVPTQIGYNLANVTLFALTALASFGLVFNLITATQVRLAARTMMVAARQKVSSAPRQHARARAATRRSGPSIPVRRAQRVSTASAPVAQSQRATVLEAEASTPQDLSGGDGHLSADNTVNGAECVVRPPVTPAYQSHNDEADRAWSLPHHRAAYFFAVVGMLMIVAMGNLTTAFAVRNGPRTEGGGWRFCFLCQSLSSYDGQPANQHNFDYWFAPSRVIVDYKTTQSPGQPPQKQTDPIDSINEFPAFSLLLADLHPHVMALPLVLLALSCALAFSRRKVLRGSDWLDGLPGGLDAWLAITVVSIVIGSLYTTNTWDYPTYLIVALAGLSLPYLLFQRNSQQPRGWRWLRPLVVQAALIIALSLLAFILFQLTFKSLVGGTPGQVPTNLANIPIVGWILQKLSGLIAINPYDKTITGFIVIFGIFLAAIIGWLVYEFVSYARYRLRQAALEQTQYRDAWIIGLVILLFVLGAFLFRFPLLGLLTPIAILALYLVWQEPQQIERNVVLVMVGLGALIGLVIEVVYLRDVFNDRQNTLFKFYYQMWMLWAVASAYGLWRVLRAAFAKEDEAAVDGLPTSRMLPKAGAVAWGTACGLLIVAGLLYSVYGPAAHIRDSGSTLWGLDGTAHLSRSAPDDYKAIYWLKANATGKDVVLECCKDEYNNPGHAGRVSSYTGIPTVLAWDGHEYQWRGGQPDLLALLGPRRAFVDAIYQGKNPDGSPLTAQSLLADLKQYNITYIFVGDVERGKGPAAGGIANERVTPQAEAVFKQALIAAYTSGTTVIYQVPAGPAIGANSGQ